MFKIQIQWGEDFDELDAEGQEEQTQTFEFATEAELKAFWLGVHAVDEWTQMRVLDDKNHVLDEGPCVDVAAKQLWGPRLPSEAVE